MKFEPPLCALYVIRRLSLKQQIRDTEKIRIYLIIILILVLVLVSILPLSSAPLIGGLAGGVAGVLGHWRATSKAVTRIDSSRLSAMELQNIFERAHYIDENGSVSSYRPQFPRWLTFKSQTIHVESKSGQWIIYGPYAALKSLVRKIQKWQET